MTTVSLSWPAEVPRSLWQFGQLTPAARPDFPLAGIHISGEFFAAFVAGVVIIGAFAWRRFSQPSYDVNAEAFRDFKDLNIWSLKDGHSLRRAYLVYCLALVFIYAALAFFGRVIFQLASQLPIAGLQVSVGAVNFDSWQWPLLLAFGIAGFAPLINPLMPVEIWLRRFSHEVVGIPTRLQEKCFRIKVLIDGDASEAEPEGESPAWWEVQLGPKRGAVLKLRDNLKTIKTWSYKEHVEWSDENTRRKLNYFEGAARDDLEAVLAEFEYITRNDDKLKEDLTHNPARLKDREDRLWGTVRNMEHARDKFAIIMAIYCDNPNAFDHMQDEKLKAALKSKFSEKDELPATGLPLYAFIVIFVLYLVAIYFEWHGLIAAVPLTPSTMALSAAMETLKVFMLVWLPLTLAATFSSVVFGPWSSAETAGRSGRNAVFWTTIPGAVGALVVAAIGLSLLAIIFAALPADSVERMRQNLFGNGPSGWLEFLLRLAPVAVICSVFVNIIRQAEDRPGWRMIRLEAVAAAGLTLVYMIWLANHSYGQACRRDLGGGRVEDIWAASVVFPARLLGEVESLQACFSFFSVTTIFVVTGAVFFSVYGLAAAPRRRSAGSAGATAGQPGASGAGTLAAGAVFLTALLLAPTAGSGQEADQRDHPVVLGFRSDLQPFSFVARSMNGGSAQAAEPKDGRPYSGYVADLCYAVFDRSGYVVDQTHVTATDRFERIRRPGQEGPLVDVLCDATTLRLDDPNRTDAGVFSPLIFVSGVSYITRSGRGFADVELGYAGGTTAEAVVRAACEMDALLVDAGGAWGDIERNCTPPDDIDECLETRRGFDPPENTGQTPTLAELRDAKRAYWMCPRSSHDALIEWFCTDDENRRDKAYFGDREIILGKLADWRAKGRDCNGVRDTRQYFTYEPYALLISKDDPELIAFVQQRVYEIFSHRAGAQALFDKWFPGQTMSPTLAWLYVLNGVMHEETLLSGPKDYGRPGDDAVPDAAPVAGTDVRTRLGLSVARGAGTSELFFGLTFSDR